MTINPQGIADMQSQGNLNQFLNQGSVYCPNCNAWIYNLQSHQCFYQQPYKMFDYVTRGVVIMSSDKGERAIKLVKLLKDKGIVKVETASELLDLLDTLIKEL